MNDTERYKSRRTASNAWNERNKIKVRDQQGEYRSIHRKELRDKQREYRLTHKEKVVKSKKIYYLNHRDNMRKYIKNKRLNVEYVKRANKRISDHKLLKKLELFNKLGIKCACCGVGEWWNLTIDHIMPLNGEKRINTSTLTIKLLNDSKLLKEYQTLCFGCNSSKHTGVKCMIEHSKNKRK